MPLLIRKARRKFAELDAHDVAHRISAYTYGNFLVLAALLSVYDANAIFDGTAILYITGTGLTTYIAHVIAEMQGTGYCTAAPRRENSSSTRWATQARFWVRPYTPCCC